MEGVWMNVWMGGLIDWLEKFPNIGDRGVSSSPFCVLGGVPKHQPKIIQS